MRELYTLHRKIPFEYSGGVGKDTTIRTQGKHAQTFRVSAIQWQRLLDHFRGQEVKIGRSRSKPPPGSLGEWLNRTLRRVGTASYVAPILVSEGYATEVTDGNSSRLKFG